MVVTRPIPMAAEYLRQVNIRVMVEVNRDMLFSCLADLQHIDISST
jgi:hypothetical protein